MITIRGKQYHIAPLIENKNRAENPDCVGCSFEHEHHDFCEDLMGDIPDDMGCAHLECVYVLNEPEHVSNYIALRMGDKDENI